MVLQSKLHYCSQGITFYNYCSINKWSWLQLFIIIVLQIITSSSLSSLRKSLISSNWSKKPISQLQIQSSLQQPDHHLKKENFETDKRNKNSRHCVCICVYTKFWMRYDRVNILISTNQWNWRWFLADQWEKMIVLWEI